MDGPVVSAAPAPPAMYFVLIAAREPGALPSGPALSLFTESDDREWKRIDAQAREVLRLDALLKQRDGELEGETARVFISRRSLPSATAIAPVARERDEARQAVAEHQQQIQALEDERLRLERAIGAQERIIAYRQSAALVGPPAVAARQAADGSGSGATMNSSVDDSFDRHRRAGLQRAGRRSTLRGERARAHIATCRLVLIDDASPDPGDQRLFRRASRSRASASRTAASTSAISDSRARRTAA